MKIQKIKNILLIVGVTIVFSLNFYNNFWGIVDQKKFNDYDVYCQSQVIGRVIKAEKDGIFSKAGFTGWVRDNKVMKDMTWEDMTYFQYTIYEKELDVDVSNFILYDSQIGGQAMTFALIDKVSPFSNTTNLKFFWIITSLSLAIILSFFILWIKRYYGLFSSIFTLVLIIASPWMTIFGRNLYWVLSSFYFPFIILLFLFYKESENKLNLSQIRLYFLSFLLVFLKLFLTGFEFVTTFLVMFTIPLFYYWIYNNWSFRKFVKRFMNLVIGSISGIFLYIAVFLYQFSIIKGSFVLGVNHLMESLLKRTNGNSADFPEAFKASLDSRVPEVLKIYFHMDIITVGKIIIDFSTLFYVLLLFSFFIIVGIKISPTINKDKKKIFALFSTTWISLLAPLSWYVIFKAHSYIHQGYNGIILYMPFCIYAFALIGAFSSSFFL